jgi:cellobiose phosphorylase
VELFGLLNPIHHADSPEKVARYKVEPYVVAADVYAAAPHTGRGGWTWYTGSAAWLYRVGLEAILGFHQRGNQLEIEPCIPPGWPRYEITWRYKSTVYHVVVENSGGSGRGVGSLIIDGVAVPAGTIDLADDGRQHEVQITTAVDGEELRRAAG